MKLLIYIGIAIEIIVIWTKPTIYEAIVLTALIIMSFNKNLD